MSGHRPGKRPWSPLALSAAVHMLIIATAAGLSGRNPAAGPAERPEPAVDDSRRIDMIYVPPADPAPPVRPAPSPRPPAPPPPRIPQPTPEPEPNAPPEATRSTGAETPLVESEQPKEAAAPTAERPAATMESEARRIFGRPRLATRAGAGPQAVRPMEAWMPDNTERCIPRPVAPSDSAGPAQLGTVVGQIFRQDNGRPLAGAHLQMIGTPHVAFTDLNGEYRFLFDMALVENCRTQYVKVTAAGYESRLLVLVVGPQVRSEDVRLRRR